jgi:hypothetical protein
VVEIPLRKKKGAKKTDVKVCCGEEGIGCGYSGITIALDMAACAALSQARRERREREGGALIS